jgi:hypothetical protein
MIGLQSFVLYFILYPEERENESVKIFQNHIGLNKFYIPLIAFFMISFSAMSQTISGNWYGVGSVGKDGNYSQYLSELVLKRTGNKVTGEFNYYFKSTFIPAKVTGTYNSKTRVLELKLIPVLNFKAVNRNGADCPMKGYFVVMVSKVGTTLSGVFETTDHYKYTCPQIAVKFTKEDPQAEKERLAATPPIQEEDDEEPAIPPVVQTPVPAATPALPTPVAAQPVAKAVEPVRDIVQEKKEKLTKDLVTRAFDESPVFEVESDSLKLTLYDNGEVDGDTIALFVNRKIIVYNQRLSDKPFSITIPIDTTVHEISMYAENLGTIPPNTALCVIMAGEKRYELILSSNFIRNGTIRFRKKTIEQINAEKKVLQ